MVVSYLKIEKFKSLRIVKSNRIKKNWSVRYSEVKEVGRGILEEEGILSNIIVRYYSYKKSRFEKTRYFAEVIIGKEEKFILDGIDLEPLVQYVTDTAWPIIQCRKKNKKISNIAIKLVKM